MITRRHISELQKLGYTDEQISQIVTVFMKKSPGALRQERWRSRLASRETSLVTSQETSQGGIYGGYSFCSFFSSFRASKKDTSSECAREPKVVKRATRIPEGFTITDEMFEWAKAKLGLDPEFCRRETESFVDYWTAKSGTSSTKLDWPATWRNWIRGNSPGGRFSNGQGRRMEANLQRSGGRENIHDVGRRHLDEIRRTGTLAPLFPSDGGGGGNSHAGRVLGFRKG